MKKANDKGVPEDEMLLAESIAAAVAGGKHWGRDRPFSNKDGCSTTPARAYAVCALGALHLAGKIDMTDKIMPPRDRWELQNVIYGNDLPYDNWRRGPDYGETLGHAFRCAMTQGDE